MPFDLLQAFFDPSKLLGILSQTVLVNLQSPKGLQLSFLELAAIVIGSLIPEPCRTDLNFKRITLVITGQTR